MQVIKCIFFFVFIQFAVAKRTTTADDNDEHLYFEAKTNKRGRTASTRWPTFDTWQVNDAKPANQMSPSAMNSQSTPMAENIRCTEKDGMQMFTATITLPQGFGSVPVFEDAVDVNPTISEECVMKQTSMGSGTFNMKIMNFIKCGVNQQKGIDGKEWFAIALRFPFVGGLRTSDDEHVTIMCRPQERMVTKNHVMDYRSNLSNLPKTIFSSGPSDLDTKVSIFVKRNGASGSSEELARSSVIEVGQELQFRAMVRSGDGWKFAKLKDLTVQRISKRNKEEENTPNLFAPKRTVIGNTPAASSRKPARKESSTLPNMAYLVLEDGCRNPIYAAIAPKHPSRDPSNSLAVTFSFKAFMFQDMMDGDTLRVLAKVMACQDQADCQAGQCLDDDKPGHGKRKRREAEEDSPLQRANGTGREVEDYIRDFELRVVMPGYGQGTFSNEKQFDGINESERNNCHTVVVASTCLSIIFVISTTLAAVVALRAKQSLHIEENWPGQ